MEYQGNKDFVRCNRRGEIYAETAIDYSLPDYNGDVRRILFTDAKVHPSGSFENGDSVDFSGIVAYTVVYSDSENRINNVSFSSDYDFTVKCDADSFESAMADISVAGYSVRLLGPRKISAKATVSSAVTLAESVSTSPVGSAFADGGLPEVNVRPIEVYSSKRFESIEREYAEELVRLDGAIADEVNVIYSDAECVTESVTADENGALIRGNMRIFALIKNGDEPITTVEKNTKIEEVVPCGEKDAESRMSANLSIGSVRCAVNADENGCSVVVNVIAELCADLVGNKKAEMITDAYRKDSKTVNTFEEFRYAELVTLTSEKEELSGSVSREELEIDGIREVICLKASPKIDSADYKEGVVELHGEIMYSGIASFVDDNEKVNYHPFKTGLQFEKSVNINCQNADKIKVLPTVECNSASATIDENQVYLSALANVKLCVTEEKKLTVLSGCELDEEGEIDDIGSRITVYYPEEGEELFDIAKKFHTSVEKITEDNAATVRVMSGGGNEGTRKLIIY